MYYQPHSIRVSDFEKIYVKSPRRVAAAIRAIHRQEDKNYLPLFDGPKMTDDEVCQKADERVDYYRERGLQMIAENRKAQAAKWCLVRRIRRKVPGPVRRMFDKKWQSRVYPGCPWYAADLLNTLIRAYYFEKSPFNKSLEPGV